MCFVPRRVHRVRKHFLTNCVSLSVKRYDGISYGPNIEPRTIEVRTQEKYEADNSYALQHAFVN